MATKKILGLDLGTNSIGWAMVETDEQNQPQKILKAGSRIIPMDSKMLSNFGTGLTTSATQNRTQSRGMRRLIDRRQLRRDRLNRVLNILGFLPRHYAEHLNRYGQLNKNEEPKLAWNNGTFLFMDAFNEMCNEFKSKRPELFNDGKKIAYDWTIYYLRKKALFQPVSKYELAWILHHYNSKRGYNQSRLEIADSEESKQVKELLSLKILKVEQISEKKRGENTYKMYLENGLEYEKSSKTPLDWEGQVRDFIISTTYNEGVNDVKKRTIALPDPTKDEWELLKVRTETELRKSGLSVAEYIYQLLLENKGEKIIGIKVRVIDRKYYRDELKQILETQRQFIPELQNEDLYRQAINELYNTNENYRKSIVSKGWVYLLLDDILFYQRPLKSKKHLIAPCPFEEHVYVDSEKQKLKNVPVHAIPQSHPLFEEFRIWGFIHNLRILEKQTGKDVTELYLCTHEQRANLFEKLYTTASVKQDALLKHIGIKKTETSAFVWNYENDFEMKCAPVCQELRSKLKKAKVDIDTFATKMQNVRKENKLYNQWGDVCFNAEQEMLVHLWQLCYSISNQTEFSKALQTWANRYDLGELFVPTFSKLKPFSSAYGSFSERAISRLLPLIREGKYWSEEKIDPIGVVTEVNDIKRNGGEPPKTLHPTRERIEKIISGEVDDAIDERVREQLHEFDSIAQFQGLPEWLASYVVYNRFSEGKLIAKWNTPDDIDNYLHEFRQHSLNNPVVEKVVLETMRVVRDIWKKYEHIDEIHLEMSRNMKKNAKARKKMSDINKENAITKKRIYDILIEMLNDSNIENVKPQSPQQQEKLRIIEDSVLPLLYEKDENVEFEEIKKISKIWKNHETPTPGQIRKYRLWLEQKYTSPYTGKPIPFSKLFTKSYEVDHVVPQSLYFDDSLDNKVVCEAEVNGDKGNRLAMAYIQEIAQQRGKTIPISFGGEVSILSPDAYRSNMEKLYAHNPRKLQNMLRTEIPQQFSERQKNDTRYITKLMMIILSNIVREVDKKTNKIEQEAKSKNMIVTNGTITSRLKQDWGINDVWNQIIMPRFERMNAILDVDSYTYINKNGQNTPQIPIEMDVEKKRIDHRHHAMDAIVIACTNQNHVNLMNNMTGSDTGDVSRHDLQVLLREQEDWRDEDGKMHKKFTKFKKPWATITQDTEKSLSEILASFKQNLRVVKHGKKQDKGVSWGICRSLHKETGYGLVNLQQTQTVNLKYALEHLKDIANADLRKKLRELVAAGKKEKQIKEYFAANMDIWSDVNINAIKVFIYSNETSKRQVATRFGNDLVSLFHDCVKKYLEIDPSKEKEIIAIQNKTIAIIEMITDKGIQDILKNHLKANNNDVALAFSPDGIDRMNANIQNLTTHQKPHKPIYKVRVSEDLGEKFMISSNNSKYVVTDKDTNLYCGVFQKEDGSRIFDILNLRDAMRLQMDAMNKKISWQELYKTERLQKEELNGCQFLFILSPGDVVYVPTEEEPKTKKKQYYIVNNFTGSDFYFRPINHAEAIHQKEVDLRYDLSNKLKGSYADKTTEVNGIKIKNVCIPIKVDRLGNIL